ncbi:MAG: hypothetical protein JXX28_06385 [Deltaproteobacteria bacterium]|nr:hypothetical protein [Deltaproteobacteria bacterium]
MPALALALLWGAAAWSQDLVEGLRVEVGETRVSVGSAQLQAGGLGQGQGASAVVEGLVPLSIQGERSSWSLGTGEVVFEGAVRVERGPLSLRCDRLTVRLEGGRLREAVAEGAVRAEEGARRVQGTRATLAEGVLTLEGAPQLEEGASRLTGERILLWLDEDRAECERCRLVTTLGPAAP